MLVSVREVCVDECCNVLSTGRDVFQKGMANFRNFSVE